MLNKHVCIYIVFIIYSTLSYAQNQSHSFLELKDDTLGINNILILGNSITFHSPDTSIGWYGNWGMAASSNDKDYVSILKRKIKLYDSGIKVKSANIVSSFEKKFWEFDTTDFVRFKELRPDLLILNIGENIKDSTALKYPLENAIEHLIGYITGGRNIPVYLVGSFWNNSKTTLIIKKTSDKNHWQFISLDGLYKNKSNTAIDKFKNTSVGRHPSDLGMKNIAERIWVAIESVIKKYKK